MKCGFREDSLLPYRLMGEEVVEGGGAERADQPSGLRPRTAPPDINCER